MKKMKKVMHVNLNYEKKKRICKNKTTKEKKNVITYIMIRKTWKIEDRKRKKERVTLPSWIDVTSHQVIFWEFSPHNSVISATIFIKNGPNFAPPRLFQATRLLKSRNQVVQLPTTPLFQPPHHSKLENVFGFHI